LSQKRAGGVGPEFKPQYHKRKKRRRRRKEERGWVQWLMLLGRLRLGGIWF
jgi:hypothetical protein